MTLATEVKKITESKPFYALTGAGDYAVEKLRELPEQLQRFQSRQGDLRETAKDLPVRAREYATTVQDRAEAVAKDFPEKAKAYADTAAARVTELYEEFALRGRKIVSKVSGEAAHELAEVAESASTNGTSANGTAAHGAAKRTTTGTARKSGAKRSHS
ncbi:hypothetical protein [Planotetraspora kaengkrachanensis]|uniref:Heparin binding hemagglutinin HbhA n=1 Tax=Planotetraspora kaengkrachanensis TaxID=575193 RepID=A0A8J3PZ87_9ACTN|nr:hypothetical protein [Planotetraspora kaengkrachanensis]GIG83752.1 hypothetical protein Pka01_68790 [Planotetraspora kaengkrachanensis]